MGKRESTEGNERRRVDCLGLAYNLGEWVVDAEKKKRTKALYLIKITDLDTTVTLVTMEAMASMA